jgi:hypothetical protein
MRIQCTFIQEIKTKKYLAENEGRAKGEIILKTFFPFLKV